MSRISKHQPKAAPQVQPQKSANAMPPAPKPQGTWVTGDNGTPDVFVPPSKQGGSVAKPPPTGTVNATGTLSFGAGWSENTSGDLVAGGKLNVDYDMNRFGRLMTNSVDGFPAWGIKAYVMAEPSGTIQERELMDFSDGMGSTHGTPRTTPQSFDIPPGTTSVQVWFKNWTGADEPAEQWDSNYGNNYRFDVQQP